MHTEGPWQAVPYLVRDGRDPAEYGSWAIHDAAHPEHVPLAVVDHHRDGHEPTRRRAAFDARLIAAAPEMYEALKGITNEVSGCVEMARESIGNTNTNCLIRRIEHARATLAKATGEQP